MALFVRFGPIDHLVSCDGLATDVMQRVEVFHVSQSTLVDDGDLDLALLLDDRLHVDQASLRERIQSFTFLK